MKIIFDKQEKQRLDKFLVEQLPAFAKATAGKPDLSRAKIQKLIKDGAVLVNKKQVDKHYFLKAGDVVVANITRINTNLHTNSTRILDQPTTHTSQSQLKIIKETDDYIVIDKPAGQLVHPTEAREKETLVDLLIKKYPEIQKVGEDLLRPGIVHRLDKEVSGLLVVARNQKVFDHFKDQFKARKIKKEYIALVYGKIEKDEGEIEFPIARSRVKGLFAAKPKNGEGRLAQTSFEVLKRYHNYTLVKLSPSTGRTHQLRVHLKALGHSIVGDQLYKIRKLKEKIKLDRIFLEANYLGFYDLGGEWEEFRLELSSDLKVVLDSLK